MNEFGKSLMEKSLAFAVRIVRIAQWHADERKEFVLSRQIVKSGTSIGANIREAQFAQSDADFISKLNIALSEKNMLHFLPTRTVSSVCSSNQSRRSNQKSIPQPFNP